MTRPCESYFNSSLTSVCTTISSTVKSICHLATGNSFEGTKN